MKKINIIFFIIFLCHIFFINNTCKADTLYVNISTGNNTYNGKSPTFTGGLSGPLKTIQYALDISSTNDFIQVAEGIYRENLLITHQLRLNGKGSGSDSTKNTIILSNNASTGAGISIYYSGGNPVLPTLISNFRLTGFETGLILARDIQLNNIVSIANVFGFQNGNNNTLRDLSMTKCSGNNNQIAGIQINHSCNVVAFIVDSCEFNDNLGGIYTYSNNPSNSNVIDFLLKNTLFKRNKQKGIYVEKLDNSVFENLIFDSCGIDTNYNFNAAIDINLKFFHYTNIFIKNSEFTHCGIGKKNVFGCAIVVKARDDGSVYGANKATLDNVRLFNLIIKNCNNGIIAGEPGKNNAGPSNINISESYIVQSSLFNLISNIQSNIFCHNNAWLSTYGPSASDTQKNSSGEILVFTWIKNNYDMKSHIGFQSDSIVWFENNNKNLQKAIDVMLYNWTLFISNNYYPGNYSINTKINVWPEKTVHLNIIHLQSLADITLIKNDLYISDSIVMHVGAMFFTGNNYQLELSDSCIIVEPEDFIIQGKVRTYRNIYSNNKETFGGLGVSIRSPINASFPDNNIVIIRTTGNLNNFSKSQVLRSYQIITHKNCGWNADFELKYDNSELINVTNDYNLQLARSYNNGQSWILSGGTTDTATNTILIKKADALFGLWGFSDSTGISSPPGIAVLPNITHIKCFSENTGKIELIAEGGFPPYRYLWSTGDTINNIDTLKAGFYAIEITDTSACRFTDTFEIIEPKEITIIPTVKNILCFGDSNGMAEIKILGDIPPFDILWQNGEKTSKIEKKKAGIYYLTITDSNKCIKKDSIIINENDKLIHTPVINHISCFGFNDGYINLQLTGGMPPYLIFWSTGQNGQSIKNLKPGKYFYSVYDSFFCVNSDTIFVNEPDKLSLILTKTDLTCFKDNSGIVSTMVSGGTPPFKYQWNNNDSLSAIQHLNAGKYIVTVFDSHLCTVKDSVWLLQPDRINIIVVVSNDTNNKCIGKTYTTVSGGHPPYQFQWNDALQQTTADADSLCSGTYTLIVSDSSACKADTMIEIKNIIDQSINQDILKSIKIIPNPFNDFLIVKNNNNNKVQISILSTDQKVIFNTFVGFNELIDGLENILPGIYLLKIQTENQTLIYKVLKQ